MKRISITLLMLIITITLVACSEKQVSPEPTLDKYISEWNKENFDDMYAALSKETTEKYSKEDFIDRYKKIYKDLGISNLKVKANKLSDEEIDKSTDTGKATYTVSVKMDSIAGPIEFDEKLNLTQKEIEDKKEWFVTWNPRLIFPDLKDGGQISIEDKNPKRGEILDRNQMPLAINDIAFEIGVVPSQLSDADQKKVADTLKISVDSIKQKLAADWVQPELFVPLKTISKDDSSALDTLMNIPGVASKEVTSRTYPAGEATSHLVGYIGKITAEELKDKKELYGSEDMIGKRGLEQLFENDLRGQAGVKIIIKKPDNDQTVLAEKPVVDGENIKLTIDVSLQEKIYKSYGKEAGTSAAINPKSGETLALVSSPGFDPNQFTNGISSSQLDKLQDDAQQPLINRFNATYAPGSVMKPISAAIGLNDGVIKPDEGIKIEGKTWSNGKGWGKYKVRRVSESDKPVDVTDALIRSDNIFFARKMVDMGGESYTKGLHNFGFAEKIPYKYPIKQSQISNSGKLDNEVLLANTSYGQGEIQLSSLHIAAAYTPILNNGNLIKPTLLLDDKKSEVWHKNLINEKQAKVLQKALREVVTNPRGTARDLKDSKLEISGKTGTAELKNTADEKGHENSWFVAYPTKDQDILISMMMEKTEDKGHIVVEHVGKILNDYKK